MAEITPELVKELREKTGIGIGKCKDALREAQGSIEEAIANLRKAGLASAVKKEGRETKEGQVVTAQTDQVLAIVEVNAETDFVVKNELFQEFVQMVALEAAKTEPESVEAFLAQPYSGDPSTTLDNQRSLAVQSLGENIRLKRIHTLAKSPTASYGIYSHMGGKIVVVVELEGTTGEEKLARDIAMHATAESPDFVNPDEIPADLLAKEREIAAAQVKGKPEHIMDKIIAGKMEKFFDQVCLNRQSFVKDPDSTIAQIVEKRAKELGKPLVVKRFVRWGVGQ